MNFKIKKIIVKKGLVILGIFFSLSMIFGQTLWCNDLSETIDSIKQDLHKLNKYQLQEKLNMFEALYRSDPGNDAASMMIAVVNNQLQNHERLTAQIRGLIQNGYIDGRIGSDGAVFIEGNLDGSDKKMSLIIDEFSCQMLQEYIDIKMKELRNK
jgi:hypothetical protein